MRCELEVPLALASFGIERNDRAAKQIVTLADIAVEIRAGIADAPVEGIRFRIVSAGHPGRSTTSTPAVTFPSVIAELSWPRNRIEPPQPLATGRVVGINEGADSKL